MTGPIEVQGANPGDLVTNDFRGLVTAITFIAFIGIWIWAYSKRRKREFDECAALPLEEDRYINSRENP